ncbi:MAG: thioesterase family protein [Spongiibacteraceae bacterium]|nr:thioesterase family protein [Spongiibacteraceae bacterium]
MTHQSTMPQVPPPEQLLTDREAADKYAEQLSSSVIRMMKRRRPIEARRVNQGVPFSGDDREPVQHLWFRAAAPLPDDPKIHRAVLAFASDMGLLSTCMRPHAVNWTTPNVQCASLDHALWVHDDFRADEWLLYSMDSPWSGGARGFNRGSIFTRDGRLIASVAQEGLLRIREPK